MTSTTHFDMAWANLTEGLELARQGRAKEAVDALFHAATAFERGQEYRQIPAVWEGIGELLQEIQKIETCSSPTRPEDRANLSDGFFLDYRIISEKSWQQFSNDHVRRLAWVYQWAAEHRERANDPDTAQKLYFRAAHYVEQTEAAKTDRPHWAARMYYRAVLNHVRIFGTATEAEPSEGRTVLGPFKRKVKGTSGRHTGDTDVALEKMHDYFLKLAKDLRKPAKAYKQLSIAYSSLKSALLDAGNVIEARVMEKEELKAARKYHYAAGNAGRYLYYWMRTGGIQVFMLLWLGMIVLGFPFLYRNAGLDVIAGNSSATFDQALMYSLETAVIMGHQSSQAVTAGAQSLTIVETALSYFVLGAVLFYITKKIE